MSSHSIYLDHLQREVRVPDKPKRIISLCPSQTSTLAELGLLPRLVGRTQFCIHPQPGISAIPIVGGTKQLKHGLIESLSPDLVIAEKEENTPEMVAWLAERYPVYVTDVRDLPSALKMVQDLGEICGTQREAERLLGEIEGSLVQLPKMSQALRTLYFIWRKPWMVAGHDTYIHHLLEHLGLQNLAALSEGRYPLLETTALEALEPELVLLSSEPFPFSEKHRKEVEALFPMAKVLLVDGEMFSWYGERMRALPEYWGQLRDRIMDAKSSF